VEYFHTFFIVKQQGSRAPNVSTIHLLLLKQKYEIFRAIVSNDTIIPSDLLLFTSKQS